MKKTLVAILAVVLASSVLMLPESAGCREQQAKPKNFILMIGDGMGFNHVLAAGFYKHGEAGKLNFETFPVKLGASTHSLSGMPYDPERAWQYFGFVKGYGPISPTDSAAAGTALATGRKALNGVISVDEEGRGLETIIERAEKLGLATGVVTTVPMSHATPAVFAAHNPKRNNYVEIAKEMIELSAVDVIMGAGHPFFDNNGKETKPTRDDSDDYVGDVETWDKLVAGTTGGDADADGTPDPWVLIITRDEFRELSTGETPKRVIGIPQVHDATQVARDGKDDNPADDMPYETPLLENVPSLAEMAAAAMNVLDNDPDGLCLMIEGGAIDWAGHANHGGKMVEEMLDFEAAVQIVIDWVEQNSSWDETVLLVTADHETGYLLGPGSDPEWKPLVNNGKGKLPGMAWYSNNHTNSLVPVYAKGRGAERLIEMAQGEDPVYGRYIDNTDVAKFFFELLGDKK